MNLFTLIRQVLDGIVGTNSGTDQQIGNKTGSHPTDIRSILLVQIIDL